jgi:hypothetical protein
MPKSVRVPRGLVFMFAFIPAVFAISRSEQDLQTGRRSVSVQDQDRMTRRTSCSDCAAVAHQLVRAGSPSSAVYITAHRCRYRAGSKFVIQKGILRRIKSRDRASP